MNYILMIILTVLILLWDILSQFRLHRVIGFIIIAILMLIFLENQYIWLAYLTWEVMTLISAFLIYDLNPNHLYNTYKVIFISSISSACLLYSFKGYSMWSTFDDFNWGGADQQMAISLAILAKSGLFPFIWPQFASVAKNTTSAYLHSITVIHLGIYLLAKFKVPISGLMSYLFIAFGIVHCLFAAYKLYILSQSKTSANLKSSYAILTQTSNILTLILIASGNLINHYYLEMHSIYKTILFLNLDNGHVMNLLSNLIAFYYAMNSLDWASLDSLQSVVYFIIQIFYAYVFIFYLELIWIKIQNNLGKILLNYINQSVFLLCLALYLLSYDTNFVQIFKPLICALILYWLTKIIHNPFYLYRLDKYLFSILQNLNLHATERWSLWSILGFIILFKELNLANIQYLFYSQIEYIMFIPFCLGFYIMWKAKTKLNFLAGSGLISLITCILYCNHGGLDIAITHILIDFLALTYLLNTNILYKSTNFTQKDLLIGTGFGLLLVLTQHSLRAALIFELDTINIVNEIVISTRLLDTLGEILVFYTVGRIYLMK